MSWGSDTFRLRVTVKQMEPTPPPVPIPVQPIGVAPPPLSPEQFRQWQDAEVGLRKIKRAVGVARFDGWTIGIFAALTLGCGFSPANVLIAVGMGTVAFVELRSAKRLAQLDPEAGRTLMWNQLALAGLLILYAVWRLTHLSTSEIAGSLVKDLGQDAIDLLGDAADIVRQVLMLVYFTLIGVAVLGQGSMALYYQRRGAYVRRYLAETPEWVVAMQRGRV